MFLRVKKTTNHAYLQIVESYREDGRVRQRVIGTIGRMEELAAVARWISFCDRWRNIRSERYCFWLVRVTPRRKSRRLGRV